ncbi:Hypothetical predicted protein, partial [Paramuricea clavata]
AIIAYRKARICAIPKAEKITSNNDLSPISILPTLSKIFERLVPRQMSDFVTNTTTGVVQLVPTAEVTTPRLSCWQCEMTFIEL